MRRVLGYLLLPLVLPCMLVVNLYTTFIDDGYRW